MICKKFSISLYIDKSHFSLIGPIDAANVLGVTGMLLALMVKFDFLSEELFFLDVE